jgi:hypothetical protein
VFRYCQSQVILAPMGGVIGIRMEAALKVMEWVGVEDSEECWEKLSVYAGEVYRAEEK